MEKQGYGKRPLWQWILIYLLIGGAVYGLIYYFVIAGRGGYSIPAPTNNIYQTSPSVNQPSPSSQSPEMTVKLNEENNSGESGTAVLKEENGKTTVTVSLTGFVKDVTQPAHIHAGSCPGVEAVKYPLASIVNGSSVTVLNATLAEIKQNLPLAVNVHKSAQESANYTACGELPSK